MHIPPRRAQKKLPQPEVHAAHVGDRRQQIRGRGRKTETMGEVRVEGREGLHVTVVRHGGSPQQNSFRAMEPLCKRAVCQESNIPYLLYNRTTALKERCNSVKSASPGKFRLPRCFMWRRSMRRGFSRISPQHRFKVGHPYLQE